MNRIRQPLFVGLVIFSACSLGCQGDAKPRSLEEIKQDQLSLPALYLTHEDHDEVIAPSDKGDVIVDESLGKLAFRAWTCNNPECPGKKPPNQRPLLFIWHDPLYFIDDQGAVNYDPVPNRAEVIVERGGLLEPTCPECLKIRDRAKETPEVAQKYRDWCQQYVLPQSAKRAEQLKLEVQARTDYIESRTATND